MHINVYLAKNGIDASALSCLNRAYGVRTETILPTGNRLCNVCVDDIVDVKFGRWKETYGDFSEALCKYDKHGTDFDYSATSLWVRELGNFAYMVDRETGEVLVEVVPDDIACKINAIFKDMFDLYDSIKSSGFIYDRKCEIKLIGIEKLKKVGDIIGTRASKKYYRMNGRKRCLICKYLGIKKIKCRVIEIGVRK